VTSPSAPGEPGDERPPGTDAGDSSTSTSGEIGTGEIGSSEPERAPQSAEIEESRPATGIRWSDAGATTGSGTPSAGPVPESPAGESSSPADDDATPPSGNPAAQHGPQAPSPGPGDVVPDRTTGADPTPVPSGAWAHPGHQQPGYQQPGPPAHPPTWPQTAPAWAPPAGPPPVAAPRDPARRRRVRRIVLFLVIGVVVVAAVVVALLAFLVGPRFARYDVLDRAAVERGVGDVVGRDWHRQVTGVVCPDGERVRPGVSFMCTATVDGRPQQVPVDVTDENGAYEVGQPR
jgi:hypothetical protein